MSRRFSWKVALLASLIAGVGSVAADPRSEGFVGFVAPGAGTGPYQGTFVAGIYVEGALAGWYVDAQGVPHGFLRTKDGDITTFDAPGASKLTKPSGGGLAARDPIPAIRPANRASLQK